ncbi:MAG: heat-shock protein [Isosphaeraceae bacterium]|jgi:molecular chaperone DnaK (HSP70)|nr:MAG: heat-shock protein [Isosphaeraceae bacterium]
MSRYVVGIDLGTTNSALAYADTREATETAPPPIRELPIPQLVAAGEVAERSVLPSFLYLPGEREFAAEALALPWKAKGDRIVGTLAREHGAKVPGRLVGSAKSWLSHAGVDRRGPILPWSAAEGVAKVSPVEASAAYLGHLRDAWNARLGRSAEDRLGRQEVLLTVPASFDAAARELTVEAARMAGLEQVTLLEEPQAAFYAWLAQQGEAWRKQVKVGDLILVCDIGGGTTDFTLIRVAESEGELVLERVAVGEHILLGGDNMDLALAYAVARESLPGGIESLDPIQRIGLAYACRAAKETLFTDPRKPSATVTVLGRGSRVVGGSVKAELSRSLLEAVLLEGFFPFVEVTAEPDRGRRIGFAEIGLPYASDPATTKHLARFLTRQAGSLHTEGGAIHPSAVLFNGGVFQAAPLRDRVRAVLGGWAGRAIEELPAAKLDLAVAYGAAYYGLARRGRGVRIRGGTSRAYYVGIETSAPAVPGVPPPIRALCVVPMGMEEGTEVDVPGPEMGLVVGEPAQFRFFGSTVRREDREGALLERWSPDELQELEPVEAHLDAGEGRSAGEVVPVRLHSHVTEVGTLELWCRATRGQGQWKLQYNVRDGS